MDSRIDTSMNPLTHYSSHQCPLHEVTELFPVARINDLFRQEIDGAVASVTNQETRDDLLSARDMNFVGYIDSSVRRAGFGDEERDALVQEIVTKLLISPGGLFSQWDRVSPFSARFRVAVRNSIITLAQKRSRRQRRYQELPAHVASPAREVDQDDLVTQFRQWLGNRYGPDAVRVFDARLEGVDTKDLVGMDLTSYQVKKLVSKIKAGAVLWSRANPSFLLRVQKLMDAEAQTVAKRFGRRGVGSAR